MTLWSNVNQKPIFFIQLRIGDTILALAREFLFVPLGYKRRTGLTVLSFHANFNFLHQPPGNKASYIQN